MIARTIGAVSVMGALLCSACRPNQESTGVYALYRNSVLDSLARYHIATFDASDGDQYNHENCDTARALFQGQEGVRTRFWCEKGRHAP